jgi:hypothetical protein
MFQKAHDNKNLIANNKAVACNQTFFKPLIQSKLTINEPGDEYEREADATAEHVMRMPENKTEQLFFKPAISSMQRKCAHCEEEEKQMQRKENSSGEKSADTSIENYVNKLQSKGKTLYA